MIRLILTAVFILLAAAAFTFPALAVGASSPAAPHYRHVEQVGTSAVNRITRSGG
jgi:hypothetical protein